MSDEEVPPITLTVNPELLQPAPEPPAAAAPATVDVPGFDFICDICGEKHNCKDELESVARLCAKEEGWLIFMPACKRDETHICPACVDRAGFEKRRDGQ